MKCTHCQLPYKNILILVIGLLGLSAGSYGQKGSTAIIRSITLEGNDRTKDFVVLRELDFEVGDTLAIADLQRSFELNEKRLLNTRLFVVAELKTEDWRPGDTHMDVTIHLKESWYLLPTPIVRFVDRNIHVWWNEQNRDLSRLIFGVRGRHLNLTGVGDQFRIIAMTGFRKRLTLRYQLPYLNPSRTLGLQVETNLNEARNGRYTTASDELSFINDGDQVNFRSISAMSRLSYRPGLLTIHSFGVGFASDWVSEEVRTRNPIYHHDASSMQRYITMNYTYSYEGRDRRLQANRGMYLEGQVSQFGLGLFDDVMYGYIDLNAVFYHPLSERLVMRHSAALRQYYFTHRLPYNQVRGIGFDSRYVRGYEPYVIDATDYFIVHNGIRYLALDTRLDFSSFLPLKKTDVIPLKIFTSFGIDVGGGRDPGYESNNTLHDTLLYGLGPSIELLLAESYLFGFDFSYNHLEEVGFYIHTKFNF